MNKLDLIIEKLINKEIYELKVNEDKIIHLFEPSHNIFLYRPIFVLEQFEPIYVKVLTDMYWVDNKKSRVQIEHPWDEIFFTIFLTEIIQGGTTRCQVLDTLDMGHIHPDIPIKDIISRLRPTEKIGNLDTIQVVHGYLFISNENSNFEEAHFFQTIDKVTKSRLKDIF